ncbi:MAG: PAS domain S-box protein [Jatrophihabitans sp.]|uniref:PAS domain S-box protein n=1 Tax=Jatrophihabitans sp. TaxID=1932789 RepID=UPI003F80C675
MAGHDDMAMPAGGWIWQVATGEIQWDGPGRAIWKRLGTTPPSTPAALVDRCDNAAHDALVAAFDRSTRTGGALAVTATVGGTTTLEFGAVHLPPTLADWTFAGVVRDVTDEAEQRRRLEAEATRSASVLAAMPDAMLVVDELGLIVRSSQQAARLFGYTDLEMIGLEVEQLVPDTARTKHAALRDQYADAPRTRAFGSHAALAARRADGTEFLADVSLNPVVSDEGLLVVATIRAL